ncbi:methylaspartate mutase subunit E [Pseudomaricurvus alkylphenolicus]|uniref:methylaspartate mutase subunit E n=1 Tax=Pseudomaricurvus alkylphenolicus TaxID=1306991 RepID=UPI001420A5BD|nr:methylaspartate mutase subunit E [Pseudomaricurvus alkylphenolicus]NIB43093.1 methylaspartate mutase subunit E [Pseudomaricurvus alkylphenolicus]
MADNPKQTILLGGIGGDSHSVGLSILRQALAERYQVFYLGTQNALETFFEHAPLCNAVMISCMDGHAKRYLTKFPEMLLANQTLECRWYLGGNLTIDEGIGYEEQFLQMGFSGAFPKYVDLQIVIELLERDLFGLDPIRNNTKIWERARAINISAFKEQSEEPIRREDFDHMRKSVLTSWKTGHAASQMQANADFLREQPSFPALQREVLEGERKMLLQPRCGVALVDQQIEYFKAFNALGAPVLSYQVDSYTRNNNYVAAEEEIRHSSLFECTINGFPVINHGVEALRRTISESKVPLQTRHSTREPRLLAEVSYAGGVTSFEGGAICYNIPYYNDYQLTESIPVWQYVDRLTGLYYEEFGIVLDREFFGTLTATLIPPCLAIATGILEALLAVQQGVRCVSIGYAEQGHRSQDIAAIRTIHKIAKIVLENAGFSGIQVNSIFHQYMAAFPPTPHMAEQLIRESAVTAALSGATRMLTKTPVEAYKIPTMRDNIEGLQLNFIGIREAQNHLVDEKAVAMECEQIEREVWSIIEGVIQAGHGNIASGIVKAFLNGTLDIPFAPSIHNRGEVMTARDCDGAVRFLRTGNLPFDNLSREFHRDKMNDRRRQEGFMTEGKNDNALVERDVLRIARGQYEQWPLFK